MQIVIQLPKAFSVRDDHELPLIQDVMTRLNSQLTVVQVATGMHVNGGATVNWGLIHVAGQPPTEQEVQAALAEAGLNLEHNAEIEGHTFGALAE